MEPADDDLTNTGVTLGTFDYISPEQARDPREADTRSDIYSLGCTLFYMLAGRPPFADGTAVQKLLQHQDQSPPALATLRQEVPDSVSQLVCRMLEKSPERRPQTPNELVGICYQLFRDLGLRPPQSLAPLPIPRRSPQSNVWRIHLPWAIPLASFLLIGAGWMINNSDSGEAYVFPPPRHPVGQRDSEASEKMSDLSGPPPVAASAPISDLDSNEAGTEFATDQSEINTLDVNSLLEQAAPADAQIPSIVYPATTSDSLDGWTKPGTWLETDRIILEE